MAGCLPGCAHVERRPVSAKTAIKKAVDLFSEESRGPVQTYHIKVLDLEPEGENSWAVYFATNADVAPLDSDVFFVVDKATGKVWRIVGQ